LKGTCPDCPYRADLTPEQARETPSESGYGVTLDGWTAYWPGVQCMECCRFVGRDGRFEIDRFEMSSAIASVEATCGRCMRLPLQAFDDEHDRRLADAALQDSVPLQRAEHERVADLPDDVRRERGLADFGAVLVEEQVRDGRRHVAAEGIA
jgi:hypothetical protein